MTDVWADYARTHPHDDAAYLGEPIQRERAEAIARRAHGTVLDVGGGDGYIAELMRDAGCTVTVADISRLRVRRAKHAGFEAQIADAENLPWPDSSFDCVVLGEVLEHLAHPGRALAEAFRVARGRVIISIPFDGWEDPTHQWRITIDDLWDREQRSREVTKGHQAVITWEAGPCWPPGYWQTDDSWAAMVLEGK